MAAGTRASVAAPPRESADPIVDANAPDGSAAVPVGARSAPQSAHARAAGSVGSARGLGGGCAAGKKRRVRSPTISE